MSAPAPGDATLTFLIFDAYGGGGVARTVITLVNRLAQDRRVRVISLYRRRRVPQYPLDPAVDLVVLRDVRGTRTRRRRGLDRVPSLLLRPRPTKFTMSLQTDLLLRRAVRQVRSGVIVSTRPSLHLALVTFARPGVRTVGWDHLNYPTRMAKRRNAAVMRAAVPRLDAFVVLTHADAVDYRSELPGSDTEIAVIRNAVSWAVAEDAPPLESPVVVSAGRLIAQKGYSRLIRAFAPVAGAHPDWQLKIYGRGSQRERLAELVRRLGLQSQVELCGYTHDLPGRMREASVYAMSSRWEGFPMVLIEAMTVGLPVIAFDCPRGPAEVVRHQTNGFLVEDGRIDDYSSGLLALVEDAELRRRLGKQALEDASSYTIEAIAADWKRLFADLALEV